MTDKEILGTIYRWMGQSLQRDEPDKFHKLRMKEYRDFIEQEWQRQDDKDGTIFSEHWYDNKNENRNKKN